MLTVPLEYDKTRVVITMRFSRVKRPVALSALLVLLLAMGISAQQSTATFSDGFHNTTLDSKHWKVGKLNAVGNASPTSQGLQLTLSVRNVASFFAEDVWFTCRIKGDFSAQVDYRLVDWPTNSGIRLGLGVRPAALPLGSTTLHGVNGKERAALAAIAERLNLRPNEISEQPGGGEFYAGEFNGSQTSLTPTAHTSGKLRIARAKDQFTIFYWDGKLWAPIGFWSPTTSIEEEWLAIELWGFESSPNIQIFLENFSISAGALNCP